MADAQAPSDGGGFDFGSLIKMVLPTVGALATNGPGGSTGFMRGMMQGRELARQHQQDQQDRSDRKNQMAANYLMEIEKHAETFDDPVQLAQFTKLAEDAGVKAGFIKPGDFQGRFAVAPTKIAQKRVGQLNDHLDLLDKAGYNLDDLAQTGAHVRLNDGTDVPIATALDLTNRRPVDASGQRINKPDRSTFQKVEVLFNGETQPREIDFDSKSGKYLDPDTGKPVLSSSFRKYTKPAAGTLDERAAALLGDIDTATEKGDTATATAKKREYDRIIKSKHDLNAADRNPQLDDINLSLKQLQLENERNKAKDAKAIVNIQPGDQYYKLAENLATGDLTFGQFNRMLTSRGAGGQNINAVKMAVYDKAGEINPNFSPAAFEMGYKFASSPKVQAQIASVNNVLSGVPDLLAASDAAKRSGVTALNKFIVPGGVAVGGQKYSDFKTAQMAFADELSGALGYGSATDMSREMGFNMTNPSLSPDNFRSAVQNIIVPFVKRKKASMLGQMGPYGATAGGSNATPDSGSGGTTRVYYDANGNPIKR